MKVDGLEAKYRTFETRIKFIHDLFSDKFMQNEILASSINYKLRRSFENYDQETSLDVESLKVKNPTKILKKLKEYK